jgi:hypothetical protein
MKSQFNDKSRLNADNSSIENCLITHSLSLVFQSIRMTVSDLFHLFSLNLDCKSYNRVPLESCIRHPLESWNFVNSKWEIWIEEANASFLHLFSESVRNVNSSAETEGHSSIDSKSIFHDIWVEFMPLSECCLSLMKHWKNRNGLSDFYSEIWLESWVEPLKYWGNEKRFICHIFMSILDWHWLFEEDSRFWTWQLSQIMSKFWFDVGPNTRFSNQ